MSSFKPSQQLSEQAAGAGCVLPSLAHLQLQAISPGLQWTPLGFQLKAQDFLCCQGTGYFEEGNSGTSKRCNLLRRLQDLNGMMELLKTAAGYETFREMEAKWQEVPAGESSKILKYILTSKSKGILWNFENRAVGFTHLMRMMILGIWRAGRRCIYFDLKARPLAEIFQTFAAMRDVPASQTMVVVSSMEELWREELKEAFEHVVQACFDQQIPLFGFVTKSGKSIAEDPSTNRLHSGSAFSRRISQHKNKGMQHWLSKSSYQKLLDIASIQTGI